ncbi:hypothetical protein, partial [Salinicola sp. CPA57]|uniref:hypothetical protein n=1 Tax=Salinicola sp. CPA57 TaxID=1949080 RepID=UPI001E3ECED8
GPQGERVNRKQVRIKARIPNLSKMEFGLKMETISIVRPEEIFSDSFAKRDGIFVLDEEGGTRRNNSEMPEYDISLGDSVCTVERTFYLGNDEATIGAKLNVVFQDGRARPLRYSDVFKLEFE